MHSRVFRARESYVGEKIRMISEEEYYDNGFIDGYHDGIEETDEKVREEDYRWLNDITNNYGGSSIIKDADGNWYWTVSIDALRAIVEEGYRKIERELYKPMEERNPYYIESAIADKSGFYFDDGDGYYENQFDFANRWWKLSVSPGSRSYGIKTVTFRLEGTLDYHC